jgi:CPA1 family monovalent cation:H+ antiporter
MFAGAIVGQLRSAAASAPRNVVALMGWSGMRGVLSLATALAVPAKLADGTPFPGRAAILFYAFSVIVVTLVVQGLPLPYIIGWLRIPREERRLEEDTLARSRTARAARDRLDELMAEGDELTGELAREMRDGYQRLLMRLDAEAQAKQVGRIQAENARLRREVARAQRQALLDLHHRQLIDNETFRHIERELDLEES